MTILPEWLFPFQTLLKVMPVYWFIRAQEIIVFHAYVKLELSKMSNINTKKVGL